MNPSQLVTTAFEEHMDDQRRAAAVHRRARAAADPWRLPPDAGPVVIRLAAFRDRGLLARLAALDSARPLSDDALVAELHGRVVAAVDLGDGRMVADPFERTADILRLLGVRREQLTRPRAERAGRRRLLRVWRPRHERARAVATAEADARG